MNGRSLSKKMVGAAFLIAAATFLAANGTITGDQWLKFADWIGGLWIGAQATIDVTKALKGTR